MNRFLTLTEGGHDVPRRFYARYDQRSHGRYVGGHVLLEAVDADWYDKNTENRIDRENFFERIPLFVLELEIKGKYLDFLRRTRKLSFLRGELKRVPDWPWAEIRLSEKNKGVYTQIFPGLFASPIEKAIELPKFVEPHTQRLLGKSFSLADIGDSNKDELVRVLENVGTVDFAAVYDVGQGNCNSLCDSEGAVRCYFDLGGGVLGNKNTFPAQLNHFCFGNNPPVILSHWDCDHWSSANRDLRAFQLPWIAPHQALGPVHRTFAHHLYQKGKLLLWPDDLPQLTVGHITIVKCTGPRQGRNHTGLSLIFHEHENEGGQKMLFPGDARYSAIPQASTLSFTNIVVPHHGGKLGSKLVPTCAGKQQSRLAYSYGYGNSYKHPAKDTRVKHSARGWHDSTVSSTSRIHFNIETGDKLQSRPRHIMLRWDEACTLKKLPCNGLCDLQIKLL